MTGISAFEAVYKEDNPSRSCFFAAGMSVIIGFLDAHKEIEPNELLELVEARFRP